MTNYGHKSRRSVRGFTILETLVVLSVTGILLGLLAVAIQRARAAAARLECSNHLRQLALASHHYQDARGSFPAGLFYGRNRAIFGSDRPNYMTWFVSLLPYVDQGNIWNGTLSAYRAEPVRWIDPPHAGNHLVVQVFTCPIDAYANTPQTQPNFLPGYQVSLTSYQGVAGLDFENRNGVLFRNSQIRFADIGDGTSNTLLIGERPPVFNGRWYGIWYRDSGTYFEGTLGVVMGVREKNRMVVTVGSCPPGYYKFSPGRLGDPCDVFHFWSFHSGGANFAFCDGTVRFLGYEKTGIMSALASRNGGDNALE